MPRLLVAGVGGVAGAVETPGVVDEQTPGLTERPVVVRDRHRPSVVRLR